MAVAILIMEWRGNLSIGRKPGEPILRGCSQGGVPYNPAAFQNVTPATINHV
jgi:hypothetical protein